LIAIDPEQQRRGQLGLVLTPIIFVDQTLSFVHWYK
jgi:hypothetical protein